VTFLPSPPHIPHRVPDDIGLRTPTLPRPRGTASHAIRVPRVRNLPSASFRSHLAVGTLAVRLGVPVIKASKGLAPSSHFPVGFHLPVTSAVLALRAMPGAHRDRGRPHGLSPPTPPDMRVTHTAVRSLQHTRACQDVRGWLPTAASRPVGHPAVQATPSCPLRPFRPSVRRSAPTLPSADSSRALSAADSALSPLPWHATALGTEEASRGQRSYRRGRDARCRQHRPLWMEDCAVACPRVPTVPHLLSGACPSPRTFVPRVLQTPPREDALALLLSFGSTSTWTGDLHPRA